MFLLPAFLFLSAIPDSPRNRLKPSSKASDSSLPPSPSSTWCQFPGPKDSLMKIYTGPPPSSHPVQISSFACFCMCVWHEASSSCGTQVYLPHSMWEFSTQTRGQTCVPCFGRWIRNHWATREVPCLASDESFFAGFPASVHLFLSHLHPSLPITSQSNMAFSAL